MADLFNWKPEYSVKVKLLDEHHKKLIDIINELSAASTDVVNEKKYHLVFSKLIEYSQYHFNSEETLMEQHRYPHVEDQKKEHQHFVDELKDLRLRHDNGEDGINRHILDFLKGWLVDHILREDMKYAPFFLGKGVK